MRRMRSVATSSLPTVLLVLSWVAPAARAQDVPFFESPPAVVEQMLELASVGEDDVVYDLGSGDGRIVIAAAGERGARAVGIESRADLVELSRRRAVEAGVERRVSFVEADFFEAEFDDATVVMLYLQPKVNRRLAPVLRARLAGGTRVVSHRYPIDDWQPVARVRVEGRPIFLYVMPPRGAAGVDPS